MTTNFYLDSKKSDNNTIAVICFIRGLVKSKTTYIKTNIKIEPELWNSNKQEVRKNHPNNAVINNYLDKFRNQVELLYLDYIEKFGVIDLLNFKSFVEKGLFNQSNAEFKIKFFDIWEKYINFLKSAKSQAYYMKFRNLVQHLKDFEVHYKLSLTFQTIDLNFYDNFVKFSIDIKKHSNNTISKHIKLFKTFLKWSYERGFHKNKDYEKFKTKDEIVDNVALTEEELFKLLNFDLSDNQRLANVRDIFCLSCFTGARFSDISNLDVNDIKDKTWHLRTQKTKEPIEIPISDYASEILNKYLETGKKLPKLSNQTSNQYLKELCKLAGIDESTKIIKYRGGIRIETIKPKYEFVSSHCGRRTFITLSLERGMRPEILMKITGHKDFKSMKRYIQITSKVKENEMMNVWKKS